MIEDSEGVKRYGSPEIGKTVQPLPKESKRINLYFVKTAENLENGALAIYEP
jgi:hypothetical protein